MTAKEILSALTERFGRAGIEEPAADARALVAFAIGVTPVFLRVHPDFAVEPDVLSKIEGFADRRVKREPVSKIIETRGFWRLDFKVTKDVLDPRPDSETLIAEVLKLFPDQTAALRILDLGTGSGCLAQALLCEYVNARAVGFDASDAALKIAAENAATNGMAGRFETKSGSWDVSGWFEGLGQFDLVISNPPYIAESERAGLAPEVVNFDPERALFAGADGLDAYRKIAPALPFLLKDGGVFIAEFGKGQHDAVREIVASAGGDFNAFGVDLGGVVRCLSAFWRK